MGEKAKTIQEAKEEFRMGEGSGPVTVETDQMDEMLAECASMLMWCSEGMRQLPDEPTNLHAL